MEMGRNAKFWRKALKFALASSLLCTVILIAGWFTAPSLIEKWTARILAEKGIVASFRVNLGSRSSTIDDLSMKGESLDLQVGQIQANYGWKVFTTGHIRNLLIQDLQLELDLDELLADDEAPESIRSREQHLVKMAHAVFFDEMRLDAARLGITYGDHRSEISLSGRLDASVKPHLSLECNSSLGELGLDVNLYGFGVGLSADLRINELVKTAHLIRDHLGDHWPAGLELFGGKMALTAGARIKEDDFIQGLVHATFRNLAMLLPPMGESGTRWAASSSMLSIVGADQNGSWRCSLAGDGMVGNLLRLDDLLLDAVMADEYVQLDLKNLDGQVILPDYQFSFTALKGAVKLLQGEAWSLAEAATFSFGELGYGGDEIVLYDGSVGIAMEGEDGPVRLSLAPCYGLLPEAQVALDGLSFEGALASLADPVLSSSQTMRCNRVLLAEEPALEDLEMTFHLDPDDSIWVETLGFKASGVEMNIRPQKAQLSLTKSGGAKLELNATTIELPAEEVIMYGLGGDVHFDSVDPLVIREPQELSFSAVTFGDMQWGPGHLAFSLDDNGTFSLHRCEGDFLGGKLRVKPTQFNLFADQLSLAFEVEVERVDAEELVKAMPGFEGELRGLISGSIGLTDRDGGWNYLGGGFLELMAAPKGYLSYPTDGLLTEDLDPESSSYKKSRLVELALQNLDVAKLRLEFMEDLLEGRFIKGEILGESTIGKKKIKVTYRPKLKGDIVALLRKLEFGGFSFE